MADGNNAAMREALQQASYFLHRHHTGAVYASDGETLIFCEDVAKIVDAALAAPPRNCDRFNTGDVKRDAQDAMEAILHEGVAGYRGIAEYLLSPICTKQEGDDNGSKQHGGNARGTGESQESDMPPRRACMSKFVVGE